MEITLELTDPKEARKALAKALRESKKVRERQNKAAHLAQERAFGAAYRLCAIVDNADRMTHRCVSRHSGLVRPDDHMWQYYVKRSADYGYTLSVHDHTGESVPCHVGFDPTLIILDCSGYVIGVVGTSSTDACVYALGAAEYEGETDTAIVTIPVRYAQAYIDAIAKPEAYRLPAIDEDEDVE